MSERRYCDGSRLLVDRTGIRGEFGSAACWVCGDQSVLLTKRSRLRTHFVGAVAAARIAKHKLIDAEVTS